MNLAHDFLCLAATILVPYIENASRHNPHLGTFLAELADGNPLVLAEENSQRLDAYVRLPNSFAGAGRARLSVLFSAMAWPTACALCFDHGADASTSEPRGCAP